ncbi:MAG: Ig-like domain repeat protein, partial [Gemmataceae bacterium]|nr:Ig-like domain repeat protein [Gemmataceae bacterium]
YSGDTNFTGSAGSTALTVGKAPTTTTLTLPQNPVQPGQPLNVSVAVTGAGQPLRPAGPVELLTGARSLGTATLTNGTAAFSIPNTTTFTGVNQLTVRYLGDANFQPSASAATQVLIQEKPIVLVGSDFGPVLCVYDNTINLRHGISDVGAGFTGVRPASGDFDGDGINDYLVGSARNAPSLVAVLDGTSKQQRLTFSPFGADFTGGVFVAAGDIDRDGRADVVASADTGGGPRVRVFLSRGAGLVPVADFFAIDDPNFRGGSRVAVGDVNGDGFADLVATAGPGGGARVAGFDGKSLAQGQTVKMFNDFFAIDDPNFRGGAFVALGDFNGDRNADFVFGAENGGAPIVTVFDSVKLLGGEAKTAQLASFFAGPSTDRGGIRVAARDLNFDGKADIITGAGVGSGSAVNAYDGLAVFNGLSGQPTPILSDVAFPGLTGGVYVG